MFPVVCTFYSVLYYMYSVRVILHLLPCLLFSLFSSYDCSLFTIRSLNMSAVRSLNMSAVLLAGFNRNYSD